MKDAEDLWLFPHVYCYCLVAKSCPALCNPMDCSLPGSSVHGISQTRILEKVAISFSRGSLWPSDQTHISCTSLLHCRRILYHWPTREAFCIYYTQANNLQKIIEKHIKWLKHKEPLYLQLISKKIFFKNVHISFKILKCFKSLFQQIGFWEYSLISSKQDSVKWSCSVVSDSLQSHELYPTRLLHPWNFPGKSTAVGCHFLLKARLVLIKMLFTYNWSFD